MMIAQCSHLLVLLGGFALVRIPKKRLSDWLLRKNHFPTSREPFPSAPTGKLDKRLEQSNSLNESINYRGSQLITPIVCLRIRFVPFSPSP
jgi:hypothetical protein